MAPTRSKTKQSTTRRIIAARIGRLKRYMDELYPTVRKRKRLPALDELILTILSQNTSDSNSLGAFEKLKRKFPSWDEVAKADVGRIIETIRAGGLAEQKAPRIKAILNEVHVEHGAYDLEHLRDMTLDDGLEYLLHFNGVGLKTASCVMLFSLGKPAFPVDTHILRVSRRLGIIGAKDSAEKASQIYRQHTNPGDRYKFHMDIIHFGREICHSRKPECDICKLIKSCLFHTGL